MNPDTLNEIYSAVVMQSWRVGWLIVALAVLRLVVRGRVPAQVWFAAWILVAARLLLPFSIPTGWSPYNFLKTQPATENVSSRVLAPTKSGSIQPAPAPVESVAVDVLSQIPVAAPRGSVAAVGVEIAGSPRSWTELLAVVWLVGVVVLVGTRLVAWGYFRRQLRDAKPVTDLRVTTLVESELKRASTWRRLAIVETSAVDAPALCGLLCPRLLLPPGLATKLTEEELRHVVRHEIGHWRRRDLVAQALMQAAVALHWFNPFVWLAARLARADCEVACDEYVLRRESPGGASAYGATLLKVLGMTRGRRRPVPVVAMLEGRGQLTHRIRMIAGYRASTAGRVAGGVAIIALVAAASLTRETRAEEKTVATKAAAKAGVSTSENKPRAGDLSKSGEVSALAGASDPLAALSSEQLRRRGEQLAQALHEFKERNNLHSLDQRRDLLNESLKAANLELLRTQQALNVAEIRTQQVREFRERKADLKNLPFIANQPVVAQLSQRLTESKITVATLNERYLESHPQMIRAVNAVVDLEQRLVAVVDAACSQIDAEREAAESSYSRADAQLKQRKVEVLELERAAFELGKLQRELRLNEQFLQNADARANPLVAAVGAPASVSASAKTSGDFTISVVGAVNQQGAITFSAGEAPIMLDAIARAGGFASRADRSAVRLIRKDLKNSGGFTPHTLSEKELMTGADQIGVLQRGDIIVVPEVAEPVMRGQVSVLGAVNTPGNCALWTGTKLTLVECLAKVGGPNRIADLKKVRLTRDDPKSNTVQHFVINVEGILRGEYNDKWPLEPGDIVVVPEKII